MGGVGVVPSLGRPVHGGCPGRKVGVRLTFLFSPLPYVVILVQPVLGTEKLHSRVRTGFKFVLGSVHSFSQKPHIFWINIGVFKFLIRLLSWREEI